jgi:hypothetical protein
MLKCILKKSQNMSKKNSIVLLVLKNLLSNGYKFLQV